jgi:hypothetical protein
VPSGNTKDDKKDGTKDGVAEPTVVGSGWSSVMITRGGVGQQVPAEMQGLIRSLPAISGSWGSGRVLEGTLFSMVIADDGRVAVGAVPPKRVGAALATP